MNTIESILEKPYDKLTRVDLIQLLSISEAEAQTKLYPKAYQIKTESVGNVVYYRGLIELSNLCSKNCLYCGIRRDNKLVKRYTMSDQEVIDAAIFAHESKYASIVIQSGERNDSKFVDNLEDLLIKIHQATNNELRVTLSCGEQSEDTYRRWFKAGAHRYLLRIESSNPKHYQYLHPKDQHHEYQSRIDALNLLKKIGYQTGTGVMIGFPNQTIEDLADDLLFFKNNDIHMIGMGPYLEHDETPLFEDRSSLLSKDERLFLSYKMIAVLRILMPDINIAAATALQAIISDGRERALLCGANVIMPNVTPQKYREEYDLYENKPCTDEDPVKCQFCLEARVRSSGEQVAYGKWGDSKRFKR